MNKKLHKLLTTPSLYFYDYFAKRIYGTNCRFLNTKPTPTFFHFIGKSDAAAQLMASLQARLESEAIPYFQGGDDDEIAYTLHIEAANLPSFLHTLRSVIPPLAELYVSLRKGSAMSLDRLKLDQIMGAGGFDVLCTEKTATTHSGRTLATSRIHVVLWKEESTYSTERIMVCGVVNRLVSRLRRRTFDTYGKSHINLNSLSGCSHYQKCTFPIDAVYTWVDGQDPAWVTKKARFQPQKAHAGAGRGLLEERFRNQDELRYSLRSLEMFAPFIRNVYLVTDDQAPAWINRNTPRLKIVSHRDIYHDQKVLPVFNSNSIETQLHHIEGLSEHFLYFNDDVFLGAMCTPEDFFLANGAMRYFPSAQRVHLDDIDDSREEYLIAERNMIRQMQADHGVFATEVTLHTPQACRRSYLYDLEQRYESIFHRCAAQRFRSVHDIRPLASVQYHFGFLDGYAVPAKISHAYLALWKPQIAQQLANLSRRSDCKTFCINDVGVADRDYAQKRRILEGFLEHYFPFSSTFER